MVYKHNPSTLIPTNIGIGYATAWLNFVFFTLCNCYHTSILSDIGVLKDYPFPQLKQF